MTDRQHNLNSLRDLWEPTSDIGKRLLAEVVEKMGYAEALSDAAIARLAERMRQEDVRLSLRYARR